MSASEQRGLLGWHLDVALEQPVLSVTLALLITATEESRAHGGFVQPLIHDCSSRVRAWLGWDDPRTEINSARASPAQGRGIQMEGERKLMTNRGSK